MKKIIYILSLLFIASYLYASNYHTSSIRLSNIPESDISSQRSCFYNGDVYFLTHLSYPVYNLYKFKVESGNIVTKVDSEEFPNEDFLTDVNISAMCVFNEALFLFAPFEEGHSNLSYYYRTDRWYGKDIMSPFELIQNKTPKRVTASVIKDTLGLFFIDFFGVLYYMHMNPDGEWSAEKKLAENLIVQDPVIGWNEYNDFGSISSTTYTLDGQMIYILSVTSKDHRKIEMWYITSDGNIIDKASYNSTRDVCNVSLLKASVEGAGTGMPIQCVYSYRGTAYTCKAKVSRMDFYPETKEFKNHENFNICPYVDPEKFSLAFSSYIDESSENSIRKKVVMSYVDMSNNFFTPNPAFKFFVWNSDRLDLLHEENDVTLEGFRRLIGVVEGTPPYSLNGYDYSDAANSGFDDLSEINLGRSYADGTTTTNGFEHTVKIKNEVFGISGSFSHVVSKEDSYTSEFEYSEDVTLNPFSGQLLMKVMMVPHFDKKYYALKDYSGNIIDTISTIKCTGTTMSYPTDHLSKTSQGLNMEDIKTYMNRNIDFDAYDHTYKALFQHVAGLRTSFQLAIDKEYTHTSSHAITYSTDNEEDLDFQEFFKLSNNSEYKTSIEITTTTRMSSELDLTLHCPGGDEPGEILNYKGIFHWLNYTDGEKNWWVIDGIKGDKPWCMTYEIFSYEEYK